MSSRAEYVGGEGLPILLITDYDSSDPEASSSESLTADDARRLAAELIVAADRAEALEQSTQPDSEIQP